MVELEHFGTLRERVGDAVIARRFFGADRHERQHRLIERVRINKGGIAPYDPARFQLPYPLEDGGRGQPDNPGDVSLGDSGVLLKKIQDCAICFVDHSEIMP